MKIKTQLGWEFKHVATVEPSRLVIVVAGAGAAHDVPCVIIVVARGKFVWFRPKKWPISCRRTARASVVPSEVKRDSHAGP
jgi:hypothetical protein